MVAGYFSQFREAYLSVHRRHILATGLTLGAAAGAVQAAGTTSATARPRQQMSVDGLKVDSEADQTAILQKAVDDANGEPIVLPAGRITVSDLRLRPQTKLIGAAGNTVLAFNGGDAFMTAHKADDLVLRDVVLDGQWRKFDASRGEGLLSITDSKNCAIENVVVRQSARSGIVLRSVSGRIVNSQIHDVLDAGLHSTDAEGLHIAGNAVFDCANNGILVWRKTAGEDGTIIVANRIGNIRNALGGSGQYGNGINAYKAGGVVISNNHIRDCAYSAIRGNAASNIQILGNNCAGLGEVAIYAEFEFQGCVISDNIIDGAATGISVTNLNVGGRLGVVQGNLIRNLFRREQEKVDKRGIGIGVEADTSVANNTIEGAPTAGIQIGWGSYMRNVVASGNIVRQSAVGITVSSATGTGACLITNNLIDGASDGAIRQMRSGNVFGPDLAVEPEAAGGVSASNNVATPA